MTQSIRCAVVETNVEVIRCQFRNCGDVRMAIWGVILVKQVWHFDCRALLKATHEFRQLRLVGPFFEFSGETMDSAIVKDRQVFVVKAVFADKVLMN